MFYTIIQHTIGLPDYFDKDLGKDEDCFIFDNRKDAQHCVNVMTQDARSDEDWEYRYYLMPCIA